MSGRDSCVEVGAYQHIEQGFNVVTDDMACRALEKHMDVLFMHGKVPHINAPA